MKTKALQARQIEAAIKVMAQHVTDIDAILDARLGGAEFAQILGGMRFDALQSVGYLTARAEMQGLTIVDPSFPPVDGAAHLDLRARQMLSLKRATSRSSQPSVRSGGGLNRSSRKSAKAGRKSQ